MTTNPYLLEEFAQLRKEVDALRAIVLSADIPLPRYDVVKRDSCLNAKRFLEGLS